MYNRFSDHFPSSSLRVLNFDDPSVSLAESFFCRVLPRASNACNVARFKTYKKEKLRVSLKWLQILKGLETQGFPPDSGYKNKRSINIKNSGKNSGRSNKKG